MTDLLTIKQAAAVLACSTDTIRRRIRAGTLRYTRTGPGGHYRISRGDLLDWVPEARPRQPRPRHRGSGELGAWT